MVYKGCILDANRDTELQFQLQLQLLNKYKLHLRSALLFIMPSYAITGASKGIGLEYVRQLAANPSNTVLAIVRDVHSPGISNLVSQNSNVHAVKGDITNVTSIQDAAKAAAAITGSKLDVLIHNSNAVDMAAMGLNPSQLPMDTEATRSIFDPSWNTAIYGVMWATNAFLPLIENGTDKKIVFTSTGMADLNLISAARISYAVPYAIAKAGMNVLTAKYAVELAPKGIKTLALSPGWVDTWQGKSHFSSCL